MLFLSLARVNVFSDPSCAPMGCGADMELCGRTEKFPFANPSPALHELREGRDDLRRSIAGTIGARLTAAGLKFADMDQLSRDRAGIGYRAVMHGFGGLRGGGHLNQQGNRIYGEIFRDLIETSLPVR